MKQNKFILTVFLIILCSVLVSSVSVENLTLDSTSGYNLTTDNLTCNFDLNDTATTSAVSWYNNKSGTFQPDMALYLPFEGNETNALLDMSGYNRDATVTGATWSSTNGHHDDNGGFYFDNGNDNLNFGDVLDITPTDNFTIMFWINKDAAQTDAIITKSNTIGSVGWSVSLESDNEMVFRMDSATTTMRTGNDNAYDNVVGTWEHWAITYPGTADNADIKMYKNGKSINEIAEERGYVTNTIENHLAHFVGTGQLILSEFVDDNKVKPIITFFKNNPETGLNDAMEALDNSVTYSDLRFVRSHLEFLESLA